MRLPRSLAARVTLAALGAVGLALLAGGIAVVVAAQRSDLDALDRDLERLVQARRGSALRALAPPPPGGQGRPEDPAGAGAGAGPGPGGAGAGEAGAGGGGAGGGGGGGIPGGPGPGPAPGPGGPGGPPPQLEPGSDRFVRVVFPDGREVTAGAAVPEGFPVVGPGEPRTVSAEGEDWRTMSRPLPRGGTLQAAARLEPIQARASRLRRIVAIVTALALLATALAATALVRLALAPLGRLRAAAGRVAETADLTVRVPAGDGPDEVRDLADDLNAMLERLGASAAEREAALAAARRFAADAGHELRTPLTSLEANLASLGAAEGPGRGGTAGRRGDPRPALDASRGDDPSPALDASRAGDPSPALAASRADARRLGALVEQLQALARGEAGAPAAPEEVDAAELVDAALAGLRTRHPRVEASVEAPDPGPEVRGDPEGLRMLVDNLLENAARHGREDGRVAATVAPLPDGGVRLTVDDDGPGIPAAEREAVLERFVRGRGARGPGSGLGLAIAAAQAQRHGGGLRLEESPLGGARAVAELPGVDGRGGPGPAGDGGRRDSR